MITEEHDEIMVRIARWMKSHREKYAPITPISKVPNYSKYLHDLKKWDYVRGYKRGEVVYLTGFGWRYLADKHPEIYKRHRSM